jgi:hypothetical protein
MEVSGLWCWIPNQWPHETGPVNPLDELKTGPFALLRVLCDTQGRYDPRYLRDLHWLTPSPG